MYELVGRYDGNVPIEELAVDAGSFPIAWAPTGFGTTTENRKVREAFRPYFEDIIPGYWVLAMVSAVRPNGFFPLHSDHPAAEHAVKEALTRYHVVLRQNRRCWSLHDEAWQHLEEGGVYRMDPTKEHASFNFGTLTRLHLVVDVIEGKGGA